MLAALVACLTGILPETAAAQGTGQINGALTDSTGGVIPGATVGAIESATGIRTDTVTGANGRYSFPSLRPTTYEIRAELTGFKTVRRTDVTLQANQNLTVNITLELGDLAETITVAGQTATVDISSATISEVVDHARIVELPIAGREVARLQTLVAGTVLSSVSEETGKSIPGAVRISANGAGERQNSYRLDGANNTDPYFQENQSFPFPDALQEFSIQTSNYSASQGNNAGAVVNVVTRSGTNTFHGGAFEYLRDRQFNSKGFFAAEKDYLSRNQYRRVWGRPNQEEQHVLLRRLAAHENHEPRIGAHQVRPHGGSASRRLFELHAGVSAALQPGHRAAVRQQPDSSGALGPERCEGIQRAARRPHSRTARSPCLGAPARIPTSSWRRWISSWAGTISSASATSSTTSTTRRSSFPRTSSATRARASNRIRAVRASSRAGSGR